MRLARVCSAMGALMLVLPATPAHAAVPDCFGKEPTIVGTEDADFLEGTGEADVIQALAGDDTIYGYAQNDLLCGDVGDDEIYGVIGHDKMSGGAGNDTIVPGGGGDVLRGVRGPTVSSATTATRRTTEGPAGTYSRSRSSTARSAWTSGAGPGAEPGGRTCCAASRRSSGRARATS